MTLSTPKKPNSMSIIPCLLQIVEILLAYAPITAKPGVDQLYSAHGCFLQVGGTDVKTCSTQKYRPRSQLSLKRDQYYFIYDINEQEKIGMQMYVSSITSCWDNTKFNILKNGKDTACCIDEQKHMVPSNDRHPFEKDSSIRLHLPSISLKWTNHTNSLKLTAL